MKPKMGVNKFGSESVTYEGVGETKKWERIESYGPKFVENIVQAISRDILMYAIRTLSYCFICGHVHDELIIECSKVCHWMLFVSKWEEHHLGFPAFYFVQMGTKQNFIKKIKNFYGRGKILSFFFACNLEGNLNKL